MDLRSIKHPDFLKKLSIRQCNELSKEIRSFLIDNVSKTGGHLSSNLGVVELTMAMHIVFDSPKDKLIFDVGHQSYVHKILTGRADRFSTLRQYEGLSGFNKRSESEHDVWEAGHSSTSLSAALGMAVVRDLNHQNHHVVALIGDGSIINGMAFEALNHIGELGKNLIIVFNDNHMSISKNVGAMSNAFARLRASKSYNTLKQDVKDVLKTNVVGNTVLKGMTAVRDTLKSHIVDSSIFGELGIEYLGPVDGHSIKELIRAFDTAKKHQGPIVIHAITCKGKGYAHSESDKDGSWHGVNQFDPDTGVFNSNLPPSHAYWSTIYSDTLIRLAQKDRTITAITPAMIGGAKLEKFFSLYKDRSFDTGIAEEHAVTFAAAMALQGHRPFLSLYSTFLQRGYDQINHDICRMDLPVVIGIDRAGLVGEDGDTHHGVFDIGILRPLPNLVIATAKDADEAQDLLFTAFNQSHPFAVRYPRGFAPYQPKEQLQSIEIGTWEMLNLSDANKAVIISYGPDVDRIYQKVIVNGLPVNIVNARFLKPVDGLMISKIASLNVPVFVYQPDMEIGGLASAILEYCAREQLLLNLMSIGLKDEYIPHGSIGILRKKYGIDINTLFEHVLKAIGE
ncbi:MAG: 1-deoxy-D-xylulose-5-phosphate synthase [Firmicutes bacterium HGW-Firmicutes-20]|nr:MAG: 1-deoxy-D-xylulose-5-phosphate synthase [Firmicutes bacterium HGW-Firmicutes-20]